MNWVWSNADYIWDKTLVHLGLSVPPIVLAFVISLPIGWLAYRYAPIRGVVLTVAGLFYAVPSFALLVILPGIIGYPIRSDTNIIVGLTLYGVALMVRSVADGLQSVEADVRQSATAIGYSPWQRFWRVEIPLAGPVLLAGLRVVVVSTVSLVTVGGILGINGLGLLFNDGFQRDILAEIVAGIVITIAMALVLDGLLVLLGRALMPWTTTRSGRRAAKASTREVVAAP
ncbi:osmoprotectant transport system permease protein [Frigoribacterium sp. PhB160]|uniref:ABC transporter permease n=1 Tax=Frigoribacterium sp. PhB160 TaxID=2485192 RepID=UPI000F484665|nr:ABC transporter permease subunit [Frigoribacterium sp. PhB160]ROS62118.1 osmoprotectant transport system permease protein [Frigoribacterium sp. PhB160]